MAGKKLNYGQTTVLVKVIIILIGTEPKAV